MDRWVVQFIGLNGPGGFAGVFFTEDKAKKVWNAAVRARKETTGRDINSVFQFTDDNGTRYCLNLCAYTMLIGNMKEMVKATAEHQEAEMKAHGAGVSPTPVSVKGAGYDLK